MHDLVSLADRGIPTILVCTPPFEALARGQGIILGGMEVPIALVTHPLASASSTVVEERGRQAVEQILGRLWEQ